MSYRVLTWESGWESYDVYADGPQDRSARVGRVIEPVHLSAGAIPRQTLLIVNHGVVAVSGVAPRRSLEAEMLRCRAWIYIRFGFGHR